MMADEIAALISLVITLVSIFFAIVVTGLSLGIPLWIFFKLKRHLTRHDRLLRHGEAAKAMIISVNGTPLTVGTDKPMVEALLEIRRPNHPPYQTMIRQAFHRLTVQRLQPGTVVDVRIDPRDPTQATIMEAPLIQSGAGLMHANVVVNNQAYSSLEEAPPEVRQAVASVAPIFADADCDGVPDIFEGGISATHQHHVIDLHGRRAQDQTPRAMECCNCGAPFPALNPNALYVKCDHCGTHVRH
jgi:hypothetical protein